MMKSNFKTVFFLMAAVMANACINVSMAATPVPGLKFVQEKQVLGDVDIKVDEVAGLVYVQRLTGDDQNTIHVVNAKTGELVRTEQASDEMISVEETKPKATYASGKSAGFTAGFLTGLGFAYRQFFGNGYGIQIGAGAMGAKGQMDANIGVEVMRVLSEGGKARFYAFVGASVYFSQDRYYQPSDPNAPIKPDYVPTEEDYVTNNNSTYNVGGGLGIEFAPAGLAEKGISFALELPLSVYFDHQEGQSAKLGGFRLIPSASIIYYFGK